MSIISSDSVQIREVWNDNLEEEFTLISGIVDQYNYVALDTEYPGVVAQPMGNFKNYKDRTYQKLKINVDLTRLIQLGLTFFDKHGNLPKCQGTDKFCVWQFNFREFDIHEDVFASDSIDLLCQSGIDLEKNYVKGINLWRFSALLMSSGIVMNDDVHFVTFHGGYDVGYLIKLLTWCDLPDTQKGFFKLVKIFLPTVYDIRHMIRHCDSLYGGLSKIAEKLKVERVGVSHQAGSDSLLTCLTFIKVRDTRLDYPVEKCAGVLFGLGVEDEQAN